MKDDKIVLYMHAGSGNHGCEAIVNSLCRMLPKPAILMTNRPKEDETYSLKELCNSFVQEKSIEKNVFVHTWYYLKRKLLHDPDCFMEYRYQDICGVTTPRRQAGVAMAKRFQRLTSSEVTVVIGVIRDMSTTMPHSTEAVNTPDKHRPP